MILVFKVSFNNYIVWKKEFDAHKERAAVCEESKTTVGKINDISCMVMLTMSTWRYVAINELRLPEKVEGIRDS
ncbi:MAG: hypothetical protein CMB82_07810 [Flammeovirgaceae bacterium]|nr:hypothetical protein [Flammeovirgaceae bacterium]